MFPTAGKLAGAVSFAAVAVGVAWRVAGHLPESTQIGLFLPVSGLIGAFFGWRIAGREAALGWNAALSGGFLTTLYTLCIGLLGFAFEGMISRALRKLYKGLGDGLEGWFGLVQDYAPLLIKPDVIIAALAGTVLASLVTGAVARRFS